MEGGALRVSRFTRAATIRQQRSALHSSLKEPDSEKRPGGLLLLVVEEAGAATVDNTRQRHWLPLAEEAEPPVAGSPPVAGNEPPVAGTPPVPGSEVRLR